MTSVAIAQIILATMAPVRDPATAFRLAPLVRSAALASAIEPALLIAVVRNESAFHVNARGASGELGLGQLKRGTMATRGHEDLTDEQLMAPRMNLRLTARHLARVRRICGGPPERWLSAYSGRACGPSAYSRHALARLETP